MGLTELEREWLAEKIDAIYHCGAMVNFVLPYEAMKQSNIIATQALLQLAVTTRLKPFHYVSSVAIFDSIDCLDKPFVYETDELPEGKSVFGGYAQSKWVAEKLVQQAMAKGVRQRFFALVRLQEIVKVVYGMWVMLYPARFNMRCNRG